MPIAGIYSPEEDHRKTEPEDITFVRVAAFDTDRGAWLSTSDGEVTAEFDIEELRAGDIEDVLDIFWGRYVGKRSYYIHRESEVPGDIEVRKSLFGPSEVKDVATVDPRSDDE